MKKILVAAAMVLAVGVAQAQAAALLKFDDEGGAGGTVSYDGAGGALVGTDILFTSILGVDTPSNDGVLLTCDDCVLNFTTGNFVSANPGFLDFAGGGTLTISGDAYDGVTLIASGDLVTGSFTSAGLVFGTSGSLSLGLGIDTKNPDLVAFFGLGPDFVFAQTQIMLGSTYSGVGAFSGAVTNADFNNLAVPEPASMFLLGIGLVGLAGAARRRRS